MQVELLDRRRWRTRLELANAMFDYLEIFHNRRRRHSALGYLSPVQFEELHTAALTPALSAHPTCPGHRVTLSVCLCGVPLQL